MEWGLGQQIARKEQSWVRGSGEEKKKHEIHMKAVKPRQRTGCHQLPGSLRTWPVAFYTVIVGFRLLLAWGRVWSREKRDWRRGKEIGHTAKSSQPIMKDRQCFISKLCQHFFSWMHANTLLSVKYPVQIICQTQPNKQWTSFPNAFLTV